MDSIQSPTVQIVNDGFQQTKVIVDGITLKRNVIVYLKKNITIQDITIPMGVSGVIDAIILAQDHPPQVAILFAMSLNFEGGEYVLSLPLLRAALNL